MRRRMRADVVAQRDYSPQVRPRQVPHPRQMLVPRKRSVRVDVVGRDEERRRQAELVQRLRRRQVVGVRVVERDRHGPRRRRFSDREPAENLGERDHPVTSLHDGAEFAKSLHADGQAVRRADVVDPMKQENGRVGWTHQAAQKRVHRHQPGVPVCCQRRALQEVAQPRIRRRRYIQCRCARWCVDRDQGCRFRVCVGRAADASPCRSSER